MDAKENEPESITPNPELKILTQAQCASLNSTYKALEMRIS